MPLHCVPFSYTHVNEIETIKLSEDQTTLHNDLTVSTSQINVEKSMQLAEIVHT